MVESALFTVLSTSAAVSALAGTRIYPSVLPKGPTLPALVYRFVTSVAQPTMDTRGMARARVEFDCFGETYSDAVNLRSAVVQTLAGYKDANITSQVFNPTADDGFDQDLLQYVAICEAYVWAAV